MPFAGLQQNAVQITAMHDGIGIAKTVSKAVVQGNAADLLTAQCIHKAQTVDINGKAPRRFADAQRVERVKGIRPKLNTGTNLAQPRRFFQDDNIKADRGNRKCSGQASDPATSDCDLSI